MTVQDLEQLIEQLAPAAIKLGNDPIGRCIGASSISINRICVALDATTAVISKCVELDANVLLTHHPLIYHPITKLDETNGFPDAAVIAAVQAGVSVLSAHTNWDCAIGGINDVLADMLDLSECRPIHATTLQEGCKTGIGRVGMLKTPMLEASFRQFVESRLGITVRCSEHRDRYVRTIGVCGGAGESLYTDIRGAADVFITSDIRHHMFVAAYGQKCTLWDAGHRETEIPGTKALADLLSKIVEVPVFWVDEPYDRGDLSNLG